MSGGGSDQPAWNDVNVDPSQISAFMQSPHGASWANTGVYSPTRKYMNNGTDTISWDSTNPSAPNYNANQFMSEFNSWMAGNKAAKQNWDNYSKAVSANEGGEGDNSITQGDAVGQRQQLLGALANAGNPTTATPGIGRMGATLNMGQQKPGVPIK